MGIAPMEVELKETELVWVGKQKEMIGLVQGRK